MAVTITKDYYPPYKTALKDKTAFSSWNGISEWTTSDLKGDHDEIRAYGFYLPESGLSTACRITQISVKYDFRSNKNSLLADSLNKNRIDTYVRIVATDSEFAPAGSWHTRSVKDGWWNNIVDTYSCNQPLEEFYIRYRMQTDDSMVAYKHTATIRNCYVSYVRTRACYITFQGEGIDSTTTMYDYGSVPSRTVSRSGYSFVGWQHPNGTVYSGTLPTAYETDVTYTAVWEAQKYKTIFDINTNLFSDVDEKIIAVDSSLVLDASTTPTAKTVNITIDDGTTTRTEGFQATFYGWCDHRDDSLLDMKGIAFRGCWYANRYGDLFNAYNYHIQGLKSHFRDYGRYAPENRTFTPDTFPDDYYFHKTNQISGLAEANRTAVLDAVYTSTYVLPSAPTKSGYKFKGWNVDDNIYMPGRSISISGDTTITAVFERAGTLINQINPKKILIDKNVAKKIIVKA